MYEVEVNGEGAVKRVGELREGWPKNEGNKSGNGTLTGKKTSKI